MLLYLLEIHNQFNGDSENSLWGTKEGRIRETINCPFLQTLHISECLMFSKEMPTIPEKWLFFPSIVQVT